MNLSDDVIEIPQFGTKHSLNVSVSAGIIIWEIFSKISFVIFSCEYDIVGNRKNKSVNI